MIVIRFVDCGRTIGRPSPGAKPKCRITSAAVEMATLAATLPGPSRTKEPARRLPRCLPVLPDKKVPGALFVIADAVRSHPQALLGSKEFSPGLQEVDQLIGGQLFGRASVEARIGAKRLVDCPNQPRSRVGFPGVDHHSHDFVAVYAARLHIAGRLHTAKVRRCASSIPARGRGGSNRRGAAHGPARLPPTGGRRGHFRPPRLGRVGPPWGRCARGFRIQPGPR